MFLVVVDAHSKWMEVKVVRHATTATTLTELRSIFATHGIPELLVSDNGSVFTSVEFKDFCKNTRNLTHYLSTIPPRNKWIGRMSRPNLQGLHEESP